MCRDDWLSVAWCNPQRAAAQDVAGMYPLPLPAAGSPEMVTRVDPKASMELAGANLMANLDPQRHYLPDWDVRPAQDGTVAVNTGWPGHNLGRWCDSCA